MVTLKVPPHFTGIEQRIGPVAGKNNDDHCKGKLMSAETQIHQPTESKKLIWAGRGISTVMAAALFMSGFMKLKQPKELVEGFEKFGYELSLAQPIGIVELVITVLYLIPQTSVLGAILLTGYLGGATATHVRIGDSFMAPIILGVLVWLGLFLRDARLRALIPFRR